MGEGAKEFLFLISSPILFSFNLLLYETRTSHAHGVSEIAYVSRAVGRRAMFQRKLRVDSTIA